MLVDAGSHQRMRNLEEQRPRTGTQQEHRLAIEPPGLRRRAVEARIPASRGVRHAGRNQLADPHRFGSRIHPGKIVETIEAHEGDTPGMANGTSWGRDFDPDELARLETRMWKAYYRRQPARLFVLLVRALHAQARASWTRALRASLLLTRAAAGFARSSGDYERFAPDIGRGYRMLGLPAHVDVDAVARHELRWWVVRRELGLAAGEAAGDAITDLYASLYDLPRESIAEAGRLRGLAAEVRDRGATADPEGASGAGTAYWPEVARLLRDSYRSLRTALDTTPR